MPDYSVNIKKLGLQLLPPCLRRAGIAGLVYALISPVAWLRARFHSFRKEQDYSLDHNGQVCRLRAVLNDLFDPLLRRIEITQEQEPDQSDFIYDRSLDRAAMLPARDAEPFFITLRGYGGAESYDFFVRLPLEIYGTADLARIAAVVDRYKLASMRFMIIPSEK